MKRLFIAVSIEPGVKLLRLFSSLKAGLADERIKWVDPANLHLTLVFLGDTEEKRIKTISNMLVAKCGGFGNFEFSLAGTGIFRSFRDPRVIWVGIESTENLASLNSLITEGLRDTGFNIEKREFKPHLTLGRIKSIGDSGNLQNLIERFRVAEFQKVSVGEIILFESILLQTGPLYKPLIKLSLS